MPGLDTLVRPAPQVQEVLEYDCLHLLRIPCYYGASELGARKLKDGLLDRLLVGGPTPPVSVRSAGIGPNIRGSRNWVEVLDPDGLQSRIWVLPWISARIHIKDLCLGE